VTPLVVDASALVDYLFLTPRRAVVEPLIESGAELHVPALTDVEVTSAIVRFLVRRIITIERAEEALADLSELPMARHGHLSLLPRVLSLRNNFSVYDATYVALAESLGAELITTDEKLAGAVRKHTRVKVA
jgi:predicted nucleic acid-binding protein